MVNIYFPGWLSFLVDDASQSAAQNNASLWPTMRPIGFGDELASLWSTLWLRHARLRKPQSGKPMPLKIG